MTDTKTLSDLAELAAGAAVLAGCLLVGVLASSWRTIAIPAAVGVALQFTGSSFNPLYLVLTFGPWSAGVALRPRRRLARELVAVGEQLEAEEARYAADRLHYERIRLARELHDTVAHWLTAVVVQAAAAQVASEIDPVRAAETFDRIASAAREAHAELERAVALIGDGEALDDRGLGLIEKIVTAATNSGMNVRLVTSGSYAPPIEVSVLAARLVQEGITNAMKHAPGASLEISVQAREQRLLVVVITSPANEFRSALASFGSGLGLAGLRERVEVIGGHFEAGATSEGGWRLAMSVGD